MTAICIIKKLICLISRENEADSNSLLISAHPCHPWMGIRSQPCILPSTTASMSTQSASMQYSTLYHFPRMALR